ncbi:hypothetical protein CPC08DRAFT_725064 [Agrocybe pediades]|nr:hypothetical protein CPC08DRAFT_725064 [Agrocybe pediades]
MVYSKDSVNSRFEPELYRIVKRTGLYRSPPDLDKQVYKHGPLAGMPTIITTELDTPRIRRFGPWVHHLFLQRRYELAVFLQHCPNVYELEFGNHINRSCLDFIPLLEKLPLKKLCFEPCTFFEEQRPYSGLFIIPFDQPMFYQLTHLEVVLRPYYSLSDDADYGQLALLPRLTHLAFNGCCWDPGMKIDKLIGAIVEHSQQIKLLVVIFESDWHFRTAAPVSQHRDNPRVVFLARIPDRELDRERGRGIRTEKAFWRTAEAMQREAMEREVQL